MLSLKSVFLAQTPYISRSGQTFTYFAKEWKANDAVSPPRPAGYVRLYRDELGWVHIYDSEHGVPIMVPPSLVRSVELAGELPAMSDTFDFTPPAATREASELLALREEFAAAKGVPLDEVEARTIRPPLPTVPDGGRRKRGQRA